MVIRWGLGLCLAIVCLVGLVEGVLRFAVGLGDPPLVTLDSQTEYQMTPNQTYRRFGNLIAINEHGMRSDPVSQRPGPRDRRVLLIGDSVVYGNHRIDQTQTIARRLQNRLGAMPDLAGCVPLVMAAAASSWGPVNQAAYLRKTGVLDADLGLLVVSAHDLYDTPEFASVVPYRTRAPWGALDDARQIAMARMQRVSPPVLPFEDRRAATLTAMDQIADQFERAQVGLTVVYHPTVSERSGDVPAARADFAAWALANGADFVDLRAAPLTGNEYDDDIHPNARGADAIAAVFAGQIATQLSACP